MNPRACKTPLAVAKSYAAENQGLSARVDVQYIRPRTGRVSETTYFVSNGKVEPDRGGIGHRNGICPICGKVYTNVVIKETFIGQGMEFVEACEACARANGWSQEWRPGVPMPNRSMQRRKARGIQINMVTGEIKEYEAW